jgi:hypothetical protein
MILNMVFHGAWVFMISEKQKRIFAYTPNERNSGHVYKVGSITQGTLADLDRADYEFSGVVPYEGVWYPNNEYSPVISAKNQALQQMDPNKKRYCFISLPYPQPVNIFPLEPYDTLDFFEGEASSEIANLKQVPALHCFVYQFSSLKDLQFQFGDKVITPNIPLNPPPYQQTANLHVLATYAGEEDAKEMEKCFTDMTYLCDPKLKLALNVKNDDPASFDYMLPPGLTKDEVELPESRQNRQDRQDRFLRFGPAHNCQNTNFFVNETDGMQLP